MMLVLLVFMIVEKIFFLVAVLVGEYKGNKKEFWFDLFIPLSFIYEKLKEAYNKLENSIKD